MIKHIDGNKLSKYGQTVPSPSVYWPKNGTPHQVVVFFL